MFEHDTMSARWIEPPRTASPTKGIEKGNDRASKEANNDGIDRHGNERRQRLRNHCLRHPTDEEP